jgi:2-phosphosulfolactate phosphatase
MKIQILELIEGAKRAEGLTVIIDVFRAFTTECYCFDGGALKCYPIGSMEEAFALKNAHPDWVLLGERKGAKVAGCDLGNSPWDAMNYDFRGKTMIHSTSAGTQGIVNAGNANASEIVTGSLVNARAVCDYIIARDPETVSLVAMGKAGVSSTPEDLLAARYMRWLLEREPDLDHTGLVRTKDDSDCVNDRPEEAGLSVCPEEIGDNAGGAGKAGLSEEEFDLKAEIAYLKDHGGEQFFDPALAHIFPREDYALCVAADRFDFVLRVETEGGHLVIRKVARRQAGNREIAR